MTEVFEFDGIGTHWQIDSARAIAGPTRRRILGAVDAFDRVYSRFRADTLVAEIASAGSGGTFDFPPEDAALFDLFDRLHAVTSGAVDPLVGADLEALGYNATYRLTPQSPLPEAPDVDRWATWVHRSGSTVTTKRAVTIDIGAAGKGYLVDRVAGILGAAGHSAFVVDASGDMVKRGGEPLRVGLEHPRLPGRVVGVVTLVDQSICASATNRRAWGDGLHHVIDGRTGRPTADVVATWAVAPEAAVADGCATALFFVDDLDSIAPGNEWVRMLASGRIETSPGFRGEVFD